MPASTSLDRFFSRYAELSLGPHPEALAGLYAPTFIVGGPEGSHAFANDDRFLEWLGHVAAFNRQRGLTVVSIDGMELSPIHLLATKTLSLASPDVAHRGCHVLRRRMSATLVG